MSNKVSHIFIKSPRRVTLPRKRVKDKVVPLNMNNYGNTNTFVNNEVKKAYLEVIRGQLEGVTIQTPVTVSYKIFKGTRARLDKMNVVAIVSKYLFDALTELGVWGDDSDDFVKAEIIHPTEYVKGEDRVDINIVSIPNTL